VGLKCKEKENSKGNKTINKQRLTTKKINDQQAANNFHQENGFTELHCIQLYCKTLQSKYPR